MARVILGIVAGLAVWMASATAVGLIMREAWPQYAAVAAAMEFTLPMMFARLAIGVRDPARRVCHPVLRGAGRSRD